MRVRLPWVLGVCIPACIVAGCSADTFVTTDGGTDAMPGKDAGDGGQSDGGSTDAESGDACTSPTTSLPCNGTCSSPDGGIPPPEQCCLTSVGSGCAPNTGCNAIGASPIQCLGQDDCKNAAGGNICCMGGATVNSDCPLTLGGDPSTFCVHAGQCGTKSLHVCSSTIECFNLGLGVCVLGVLMKNTTYAIGVCM